MDLSDVYSKNVKNTRISNLTVGSHSIPPFERDPTIKKLEEDLFAKIKEISEPEPVINTTNLSNLKQFSLEDAIKELQSMQNKGK
jgi:hypothetical protein